MSITQNDTEKSTSLPTNAVSRMELKDKFKNGKKPSEDDFLLLINSMVNIPDDSFWKDGKEGFVIVPETGSNTLLTFYNNINSKGGFFSIEKNDTAPQAEWNDGKSTAGGVLDNDAGASPFSKEYLRLNPLRDDPSSDNSSASCFFFHRNGNLGIGKEAAARHKIDVDGFIGAAGRIGTYGIDQAVQDDLKGVHVSLWDRVMEKIFAPNKKEAAQEERNPGEAPADGKWHMIIGGLDNCNAFEIMARCGKVYKDKKTGKFSMMHAIAVSTFGVGKIRRTCAHYKSAMSIFSYWNKINLKWRGKPHNYSLWIRTNSYFGEGEKIFYRITRLWDDPSFINESGSSNDNRYYY